MNDYSELIRYMRWLATVRICETKMVDCHNCEFHGLCTDPDSDDSIAEQIVKHNEAASALEALTAENEPLVRCGECIHFEPYDGEEYKGNCNELVGLDSCMYEDDYCSYGERKPERSEG